MNSGLLFKGHLHNMSWLAVSIPPILKAMLFSWALHHRYKAIIDLFISKQKNISIASIDSIVWMHNSWMSFFSLVLMTTPILSRMIY